MSTEHQEREAPRIPDYAMACIQTYGDARADDDGTSAARLGEAIKALRKWGASLAALAAQPQAAQAVPQDLESLAINRYRPVPAGVVAYKVVAGDGERSLFSGTKDECQIIARRLTEAFLDGAHAMLAAAPSAPNAAPIDMVLHCPACGLQPERKPLTDTQIEAATGAKPGTPLWLVATGFVQAIEAAHGIKGDDL